MQKISGKELEWVSTDVTMRLFPLLGNMKKLFFVLFFSLNISSFANRTNTPVLLDIEVSVLSHFLQFNIEHQALQLQKHQEYNSLSASDKNYLTSLQESFFALTWADSERSYIRKFLIKELNSYFSIFERRAYLRAVLHFKLALLHEADGNMEQTKIHFENFIKHKGPASLMPWAAFHAAENARKEQRWSAAQVYYPLALKLPSTTLRSYMFTQMALIEERALNFNLAISYFWQALESSPHQQIQYFSVYKLTLIYLRTALAKIDSQFLIKLKNDFQKEQVGEHALGFFQHDHQRLNFLSLLFKRINSFDIQTNLFEKFYFAQNHSSDLNYHRQVLEFLNEWIRLKSDSFSDPLNIRARNLLVLQVNESLRYVLKSKKSLAYDKFLDSVLFVVSNIAERAKTGGVLDQAIELCRNLESTECFLRLNQSIPDYMSEDRDYVNWQIAHLRFKKDPQHEYPLREALWVFVDKHHQSPHWLESAKQWLLLMDKAKLQKETVAVREKIFMLESNDLTALKELFIAWRASGAWTSILSKSKSGIEHSEIKNIQIEALNQVLSACLRAKDPACFDMWVKHEVWNLMPSHLQQLQMLNQSKLWLEFGDTLKSLYWAKKTWPLTGIKTSIREHLESALNLAMLKGFYNEARQAILFFQTQEKDFFVFQLVLICLKQEDLDCKKQYLTKLLPIQQSRILDFYAFLNPDGLIHFCQRLMKPCYGDALMNALRLKSNSMRVRYDEKYAGLMDAKSAKSWHQNWRDYVQQQQKISSLEISLDEKQKKAFAKISSQQAVSLRSDRDAILKDLQAIHAIEKQQRSNIRKSRSRMEKIPDFDQWPWPSNDVIESYLQRAQWVDAWVVWMLDSKFRSRDWNESEARIDWGLKYALQNNEVTRSIIAAFYENRRWSIDGLKK